MSGFSQTQIQTLTDMLAQAKNGEISYASVYEEAFSYITTVDADGNPNGPVDGVDPGDRAP